MTLQSLLVANRGEIAIRVMRAAAARGLRSVAVYSEDELGALHTRKADAAQPLRGTGAAAYLDIGGILAAARAAGCDAIHQGYGFLVENAEHARRCAPRGMRSVAGMSEDLLGVLHTLKADAAQPLLGTWAAAYLDIGGILAAARAAGCDALHPGYGFLSENAELARRCAAAGVTFVGPTPDALERFGDKARARALARSCGIPVLEGTEGATSLADARALLARLPAGASLMIKAVAG